MGESRENGVARGGDYERVTAATIKHVDTNGVKFSHLPFDKGGLNLVQYRPEKWEEKDDN